MREEANYPDSSGAAAIDGTGSHFLLEMCLQTGRPDVRAEEFLFTTIGEGHEDKPEGWYVDRDRCERVQMALDYMTRRRGEINIQQVETEIQSCPGYYFGRKDWYGTVDVFIKGSEVIEVIDYKDGRMFVDVKDNSQLISYAAGRLAVFITKQGGICDPVDCDMTVRMTIIQPKTNPAVRYVDMSATEVWARAAELAAAAALTDNPDAPLIAGKHCQWCKHKGACPEHNRGAMEGVQLMTAMTPTDGNNSIIEAIKTGQIAPTEMSDERIAAILDADLLIRKMIEAVKEEAQRRVEAGGAIPGYEMGHGRGKREWSESDEIVEKKLKGMRFLKGDIYPAKMVTPAAALKHEGMTDRRKKVIESMVETVPGPAKLVKSKVSEVQTAEEMFAPATTEEQPAQVEDSPQPMSFM